MGIEEIEKIFDNFLEILEKNRNFVYFMDNCVHYYD